MTDHENQISILQKMLETIDQRQKIELLMKVVRLDDKSPFGLYAKGVLQGYENDLDGMVRKIGEALKLQPNFPLAHNDLGMAYFSRGDFQKAEEAVREAINQSPEVALFHNNLGAIFERQGRYEEARSAYQKAIDLGPEFVLARFNLGTLFYYTLDLDDEAEEAFREIIRLDPAFAAAHTHIGLILCDKQNYEDAEEELEEALDLDPDYWRTHLGLAYLYASMGDTLEDKIFYDESLECTKTAIEKLLKDKETIEKEPWLSIIFAFRGYVNGQIGNYRDARADFLRVRELDPKNRVNKRNLRRVSQSIREKMWPLAVKYLTTVLGIISFMTFLSSFWLFLENLIDQNRFVIMTMVFFALTVACLYLPHITRLKMGPIELEKGTAKALPVPPRFEF